MYYVYCIGPEIGPQKIGITNNIQKRLQNLQTGHPGKLFVHHTIEAIDFKHAKRIESKIHHMLNHHRTKGEWFNISIDEGKAELDFAAIHA